MENRRKFIVHAGGLTIPIELEEVTTVDPTDPGPTDPPEPPDPVDPPKPATGTLSVGINTHPWIKPSLLSGIGRSRRHYISSYYLWTGPNGEIKPQPMQQGGTSVAWGLDDLLTNEKAAGNETLLCIHQTPTWFRDTGRTDGGGDYAPCKAGADRTNPGSYVEYAKMLWQVTARYGAKAWPLDVLNVKTEGRWTGDENVKKTGLNLLKYIEVWNEEKWWKRGTTEAESYLEPEVMAALMSACYDGHEGGLGQMAGIKNADPSMQVVMPGLADFAVDYVQAMGAWFRANRKDKKWPCDVANLHHYSNIGNQEGKYPPTWNMAGGCLPRDDKNFRLIKFFIQYFKQEGLPLWMTEVGYDTGTNSPMQYPGGERAVGLALVDTIKAYRAEGVARVFLFTAADEPEADNGGLYKTSGLLHRRNEEDRTKHYARKASFQIVADYVKTLEVAQGIGEVWNGDRTKTFAIPKP